MPTVDLNADLGEGYGVWRLGDDDALLEIVTSANVACGFHAGDPSTLRRVCERASERGVAIGAQVSYHDLVGFGRRFIDVEPARLRDDVLYQLGALGAFATAAGATVSYAKPHGALYHACRENGAHAEAVADAVREFDASMGVLGAPGSVLLDLAAERGLSVNREGFADRGYQGDGNLVPRSAPGAVVVDRETVVKRVQSMVSGDGVRSVDGSVVPLEVDSICVHGDSPDAVAIARAVRSGLEATGVSLRAFSDR